MTDWFYLTVPLTVCMLPPAMIIPKKDNLRTGIIWGIIMSILVSLPMSLYVMGKYVPVTVTNVLIMFGLFVLGTGWSTWHCAKVKIRAQKQG
ncbi:hypothetical protein KJ910_00510 [Patescibacteria group bacterium]|nr:hypothetical protein [Patescibacteria group bacterium]MBU1906936.1 hypothetical protein [Patescibacteria group bacterium]